MTHKIGRFRTGVSLVLAGCLCLKTLSANASEPVVLFPVIPGASFYGLGGNGWTATGDVMAPVLGKSFSFTYIDPQIYYHNNPNDYTASAGVGQRWLTSRGILGAYVFGDYNRLNNDNHFWFVSPGIERLGEVLDFSLNGYIPVSSQRINNGIEFANPNNINNIVFSDHNQYGQLIQSFDSTGWGVDGEVGVRLPLFRNAKVYVGGYYFAPKDNDTVGGGMIRVEVPINNYVSLVGSEAYDSEYHNTLKGGLTLWLGGRQTGYRYTGDLASRLVDPVQRNIVALAGGSHTAQPILSGTENAGLGLELTHISFFVPANGEVLLSTSTLDMSSLSMSGASAPVGEGTYENPYRDMLQANVDDANIKNNRLFYINSGNYQGGYESSVNPNFIVLNNDQLYGRMNAFRQPAEGVSRPLIVFANDGFEIPVGDVNDSMTALQLIGHSGSGTGIFVDHDISTNLSAPDVLVNLNQLKISNFGDGIDIFNGDSTGVNAGVGNATVNINNSVVSNTTGVNGVLLEIKPITGAVAGYNNGNNLVMNFNADAIKNNALDATDSVNAAGGVAVFNDDFGTKLVLNVNNSLISNNSMSNDNTNFTAGGIAGYNASLGSMTINIGGTEISNNTILNSFANEAGGLAVENEGGIFTVNVNHSQILNNDMSTPFIAAGGIAADNNGNTFTLNVMNSTVKGNSGDGETEGDVAGGIAMEMDGGGPTIINVINSTIANNTGTSADSTDDAAGGIALLQLSTSPFILNVANSNISGNVGNTIGYGVGGGIAFITGGSGDIAQNNLYVSSSQITNNDSNNDGAGIDISVTGIGGGGGTTTFNVSNSLITGNQNNGIAVFNQTSNILLSNVDRSQIYNNAGVQVSVFEAGTGPTNMVINRSQIYQTGTETALNVFHNTVAVTNPVYFNGVVNVGGGGMATFPVGIVITSGPVTVICPLNAGACFTE